MLEIIANLDTYAWYLVMWPFMVIWGTMVANWLPLTAVGSGLTGAIILARTLFAR